MHLTASRSTFIALSFILFLAIGHKANAQDNEYKNSSIRTGIGLGINEGKSESGMGIIYSIGWQKNYGKKERIRVNPNIIIAGFTPFAISDTRDQFYRITSLGLNVHYDLLKYKAYSIVTTVGGFMNYSRGLLGTGGWPHENNNRSEYFHSLYFGGNVSIGARIDRDNRRIAYEVRPVNIQYGSNGFVLGYMMFGIDIKLRN